MSLSGHQRGYRGISDVWLTPPHIIEAHMFARVRDDGRAEAALLAEYGRRCGA